MRFLPLLLLTFVAFLRAESAELALVGGSAFRAPEAALIRDAVLLVRDGQIAAVGSRAEVAVPADAEIVDCTGRFIIAGFTNAHVHIMTPELLDAAHSPAALLDAAMETMFTRWASRPSSTSPRRSTTPLHCAPVREGP